MKTRFNLVACVATILAIMFCFGFVSCKDNAEPEIIYVALGAEDKVLDSPTKTITITSKEAVSWSLVGGNDKDADKNNDTSYNAIDKLAIVSKTDKELVLKLADNYNPSEETTLRIFGTLISDNYRYGFVDIKAMPYAELSISSEDYVEGEFIVGDTATINANLINSDAVPAWTVVPEDVISLSMPKGKTITITAEKKGTAVLTATAGDVVASFNITVDIDYATLELTSLPWSVELPIMGTEGALTYTTSGNGHKNWGSMSGTANYAGFGFDGEFIYAVEDESELYHDKAGLFFNYYAGGETEVGCSISENANADLRGYMTVFGTSLPTGKKSVKVTIKAANMPENDNVAQLAICTPEKYVLASEVLTDEVKDYVFYVDPNDTFWVINNGPKNSFMGIYAISAEESDENPIVQTPSITSVAVTIPAQVQVGQMTQATATVAVKYAAAKTVTWSSADESIATVVADTGVVTGVAAGTVKITATSTVDSTKYAEAEIEVITGELKPQVGETYTWDIKDYATSFSQGDPIADDASNDTFLSWTGVKYHSDGYGVTCTGTYSIKVAGDVVVSIVGSVHSSGTFAVVDAAGNAIASGSTKTSTDKTPFAFIYKGEATTLTISFAGTNYLGTVEVKPWTDEVAKVVSVSIDETKELAIGAATKLSPTVIAQYFADPSLTWTTSNEAVATVDESGIVNGVSAGTATITATSVNNPEIKATCEVTVTAATVVINTNTFDFTKGIENIVAEEDATKGLILTGSGFQDATNYGAKNAGTATFDVTGPALITFYPTYKMEGTVTLYATGDTTTPLADATISTGGNDAKIPKAGTGEAQDPLLYAKSVMYTGEAATLDLAIAGSNVYFWKIVVNQF